MNDCYPAKDDLVEEKLMHDHSKWKDSYSEENRSENSEIDSLAPLPFDGSVMSFSVGSCGNSELIQKVLAASESDNATTVSVNTDVLSGVDSVMGSVAMLSLDMTNQADANDATAEEEECAQDLSSSSLCCIHVGSATNIYRLNDPKNKLGGKTNAVVIKVTSEQFPSSTQIERLENERNISQMLSDRCIAAVRPVLDTTSLAGIGMVKGDNSRMICLEWLPGQTLREWVRLERCQQLNDNAPSTKDRFKPFIYIAMKIANSLSEIHEAGGVALNNLSSENIIINNGTSKRIDDYDIHMIGLGSASLLHEIQYDGRNTSNDDSKQCGVRWDLCCMGEVFFELFSGRSPHQDHFEEGYEASFDEGKDSSITGAKKGRNLSLRNLRSMLVMSLVPLQLAAFILEVMGMFRSSLTIASDHNNSDHFYYKSAREIGEQLLKMISEDFMFDSANHESAKAVGWLKFTPNTLYGRREQQSVLMSAYRRVMLCGEACEIVLVSGLSGTGKTAFVKQTLLEPITSRGGLFLHVKFDQLCQTKPLAAILTAFTDFCNDMLIVNHGFLKEVMIVMEQMTGIEGLIMLAELIPTFGAIIGNRADRDNVMSMMSQNRLIFLFQSFVKAITGQGHPMILFFDDLQWADKTSLDLIRALIMDPEKSSLLFVESYRTNEVTRGNHPFSDHLDDLKPTVKITEIQLQNLKIDDVNELLSDAICEPQCKTEPLSGVVYRKTGGNALLATQFVSSLWDEGLLWYSFYRKTWQWSLDLIQSKKVLKDAASLMAQKVSSFSSELQLLLKKMACLGSECEESTLCLLVTGQIGNGKKGTEEASSTFRNLNMAVQEGILDKAGSKYKFAHDQIQLATYSLIPQCERSSWHLKIGKQIISSSDDEMLENMLFVIVDQLNRGKLSITKDTRRIELAELNYRAGKKAKSSCMFSSSALYFEHGISLLGDTFRNDHYRLWLRLHTSYAESQFRIGNFEKMSGTLGSALTHARSFDDQLPSYRTLIFSLGAQKKMKEAIEMGLRVLEEAGIQFPADPDAPTVQKEVLKTRKILDEATVDSFVNKVTHDEKMITLMEILDSLSLYAVHGKQVFLPLFVCRIIEMSARHGICPSTFSAISVYCMLLCGKFGDVHGGKKYGKFVLSVMENIKALNLCCRVYPGIYGVAFPRTEHLDSCRRPILTAYNECIKVGDTEYAIVNGVLFSTLSFQSGGDLESLIKFVESLEMKAKEYMQLSTLQLVFPVKQAALNLMCNSDNPALLEGTAINFKEHFSTPAEKQNIQVSFRLCVYQMQLAYMFNELELAAQMAERVRHFEPFNLGKFEACETIFYDGLVSFIQARKTNKDTWIEHANTSIRKMELWSDDAPRNCEHKLRLLEAEQCYSVGSNEEAIDKYESAIAISGENGFIQDQALSYERAAIFCMENGDESNAIHYFGKAHSTYLKWGAKSKADHICNYSPL